MPRRRAGAAQKADNDHMREEGTLAVRKAASP
jgi:hypothetical protein